MNKIIFLKILGVLCIILAAFLSLSVLVQIPRIINESNASTSYGAGYLMGSIIGLLLFATVAFFLFKYGIQWLSRKKDKVHKEGIDDIGQIKK